jgi:N-acetylmuramoyl-L-alanine amidase
MAYAVLYRGHHSNEYTQRLATVKIVGQNYSHTVNRTISYSLLSILISNHMQLKPRLLSIPNPLSAIVLILAICQLLCLPSESAGSTNEMLRLYMNTIVDYRDHLNPFFPKRVRKRTKYIIVHTSECDLKTTLKIVSAGKQDNFKWVSRGGHTHYVIAANGQTYRILDEKLRAHHAGRSMWNGERHINRVSVGIELVGYHNGNISDDQYKSLGLLIAILKNTYRLDDRAVLTHSQVAYLEAGKSVSFNKRGRKHCARNFNRKRAGLKPTWPYDPDVKAGRLRPDPLLSSIFYGTSTRPGVEYPSYVIQQNKTAWQIAGDKYNSPDTIYKLPGGLLISGNRINKKIGWGQIPIGTEVFIE